MTESRKTAMIHIIQEYLQQSKIVISEIEILNKLDNYISPILEKIIATKEENQKFEKPRD